MTPGRSTDGTARRAPSLRRAGLGLAILGVILAGAFLAAGGSAASPPAGAALFPGAAPAALGLADGAAEALADPLDGLFGRTMVGLALFAIALVVVLVIVRRRFGARPFERGRRLALVETLPLGGRRFVCLLSLDRERLLVVGVSGDGFSLLSESRDGASAPGPAPGGRSFETALEKAETSS